jgi:anti-sigma B factor antagonist
VNRKHPYLTIEMTRAAGTQTIVLTGEADLAGAPKVEETLIDACADEPALIVVDLRNLTFIDSSGLQALITGHERCRARGQEMRIIPAPARLQRLFELTGVNDILPFCDPEASENSSH